MIHTADTPHTDKTDPAHRFLLVWRNPDTGRSQCVGHVAADEDSWQLHYTATAATHPIPGFTGLRQFPNTRATYHGTGLFPFIKQHTMHRGKLDYDEAIRELGLDPSTATAVDEIIRSTGRRLTSPFFLVEQPVEHRGRLRGHFLLSGVDRIPQEEIHLETTPVRVGRSLHERTLTSIKPHDRLFVLPEVRDEKQRQPLLVCANHNGTTVPVGRIPDYLVPPFHNLIEKTGDAKVFAHHVNSPGTVSHLRVLMLLDTPAPPCNPFEGL